MQKPKETSKEGHKGMRGKLGKDKMAASQKKNNHPWRTWNPNGFDGKYLPLTEVDEPDRSMW